MSTRACYRFFPENGPFYNDFPGVVTVYKHHDGYPKGAATAIEAALDFAWALPRFEADEFAAAFVAAGKQVASRSAKQAEYRKAAEETDKPEMKDYYLRHANHVDGGGGVRLVPYEGLDAYQRFASDIEFLYDIRCVKGKIQVTAYTTRERDGIWEIEKFFEGSTKQLAKKTLS